MIFEKSVVFDEKELKHIKNMMKYILLKVTAFKKLELEQNHIEKLSIITKFQLQYQFPE